MGAVRLAGLGALVFAACAALFAPAPAGAHAQLVAIEPAAGAELYAAPAAVRLEFNEPVAPLVLAWVLPDGVVAEVVGRVEGATVVVTPPAPLPAGAHVLNWRVVSLDGHPIAGAHVVSFGVPGGEAAAPAPQPGQGPARLAAAARLALTLTLAFGVGGAVYLRLVDPAPGAGASRLALAAALAAAPAAAFAFGAQGLDLLGLPPWALLGPAPWSAALGTRFAAPAALGALAGLAAAGALARGGRVAAALAWALAAASFATTGHAAQAPPVWLTAPAVALHGAAAVFWVGALPPLLAQAVADRRGLGTALRAFSRAAVPLVGLLVLSGAALAWAQLGAVAALWTSDYGRLLGAKLIAVGAMLALAAWNRLRLTPAVVAGRPGAARRLARSVRAEIALGVLALALATGFRLTPPPRAIVAPIELRLEGEEASAKLTLHPGRVGLNSVEITLAGAHGHPLQPRGVTVSFALPALGIAGIEAGAVLGVDRIWRVGPVDLPQPGAWTIELEALIDDFTLARLSGQVALAP